MFAEVQVGVMVPSFLLAAIIVTPFGLHQVRQMRARRAAIEAANAPPPEPARVLRPRLEDVVASIERAGSDRHGSDRHGPDSGAVAQIVVPRDVTVDDRDVSPQIVDALVRDALRRSSLVATTERDTPEGLVIECRRVESAS